MLRKLRQHPLLRAIVLALSLALGTGTVAGTLAACGASSPSEVAAPQPIVLTDYSGTPYEYCVWYYDAAAECGPGSYSYVHYGSYYDSVHWIRAVVPAGGYNYGATDMNDLVWAYFLFHRSYYDSSYYVVHYHVPSKTYATFWSTNDRTYSRYYSGIGTSFSSTKSKTYQRPISSLPKFGSTKTKTAPVVTNQHSNGCAAKMTIIQMRSGSSKSSTTTNTHTSTSSGTTSRPKKPTTTGGHSGGGC